jgi:hypothetical protein
MSCITGASSSLPNAGSFPRLRLAQGSPTHLLGQELIILGETWGSVPDGVRLQEMDSETLEPPVISVRRMRARERQAVKTLAGRAFPPLGGAFFPLRPTHWSPSRKGKWSGSSY